MNNGSVAPVIISGINCGMVPDGVALNVGKVFGFAHKLRCSDRSEIRRREARMNFRREITNEIDTVLEEEFDWLIEYKLRFASGRMRLPR